MPVYRVITEKESAINDNFVNVYYMNLTSMADAVLHGELAANGEEIIHGSTVNFTNIHVDEVGTSAFTNQPISAVGSIAASLPMKSNLIARVRWGVPNYYPHYKDYRVHLQGSSLNGIEWGTAMLTQLGLFIEYMNDNFLGVLCTKSGVLLESPVFETEYYFRNTTNKWHNRTV